MALSRSYSGVNSLPAYPERQRRSRIHSAELDRRIAIVRDNIRQLIEQAAALSGAEDEARNADRIAQQNEELERLLQQREALPKK